MVFVDIKAINVSSSESNWIISQRILLPQKKKFASNLNRLG